MTIEGSGSLLARAQRTGDPLVDATTRGDLATILKAALLGMESTLASMRTRVIEAKAVNL